MSRHWKERLDPNRHTDHMGGRRVETRDNLLEACAYFVQVCDFTFEFVSVSQILECRDHFAVRIHPSGKWKTPPPGTHWNHPWYERLPMWLFEESKRQKVLKALGRALDEFDIADA